MIFNKATLRRGLAALALALAAAAGPALAQDLSVGSEAKSWNLYGESPAFFEAKVVDVLCAVTGDCPADCGAGARQMGLVRTADNVLVNPMKNGQPVFSGAASELLPFCGKTVEVDGLLITDPDLNAQNVYLVQKIREKGTTEWVTANHWTKDWAARNPEAAGDGPWYNRDPRVKAQLAANGYFGLGLEKDKEILKQIFE